MAIKRTYVYRNGKIVEITGQRLEQRQKRYPADKAVMVNRDAVMSIPEASHMAHEEIAKIKSGKRSM
jgi:hypothetical protein